MLRVRPWRGRVEGEEGDDCFFCFVLLLTLLDTGIGRLPGADAGGVLLCLIDPRVRKMRNEASSCPGIFSRTLRFYYVVILRVFLFYPCGILEMQKLFPRHNLPIKPHMHV